MTPRLHVRAPRGAALAVLGMLALAACATATFDEGEPKSVAGLSLPPYGQHEECARLAPGDRIDYSFAASAALDFDIRYRAGNAVVSPLSRAGTQVDAGMFAPALAADYCLHWEAGPAGNRLDYRIRLRRAGS